MSVKVDLLNQISYFSVTIFDIVINSARAPINQLDAWNLCVLSYVTDGIYREGKVCKKVINYEDRACGHRQNG
jgi:hypothetical protein